MELFLEFGSLALITLPLTVNLVPTAAEEEMGMETLTTAPVILRTLFKVPMLQVAVEADTLQLVPPVRLLQPSKVQVTMPALAVVPGAATLVGRLTVMTTFWAALELRSRAQKIALSVEPRLVLPVAVWKRATSAEAAVTL